ncbi:MAG TPA: Uma2 family endonuclease [Armatimonadota bacterium]|jgi:Uma2 family endonuclease
MVTAVEDHLLHSPRLGLILSRLQEAFAEEQGRREEFLRTTSEEQKVEFINGEVVPPSPVMLAHDRVSGSLYALLRAHVLRHRLGHVGHEKLLVSLSRNDYEPDVCFFRGERADGFLPDQRRFPAPDFVAEVLSESTEANDRGVKLDDYAAHGVTEYWILDPDQKAVEQYVLAGDAYVLRARLDSGAISSVSVEGFTLPLAALFGDQAHLECLRRLMGE